MTNKYWKEILNGFGEKVYILYFSPFGNEEELLRFSKDTDGYYIYISDLLNIEYDYLDCEKEDSIDYIKMICEEMIEEYYEDEIAYNESLLRLFKEK